ncbi:MAG TPA: hypothetical protein PLO56_00150 [Rhodothermales bacterium]|nr:hypothetical protein [Rhodothermales bacterium]
MLYFILTLPILTLYNRIAVLILVFFNAFVGVALGQDAQDLFDTETQFDIQDEKKLSVKSKSILKNLRNAPISANTQIVKIK